MFSSYNNAVKNDDANFVKALIEKGLNVNEKISKESWPLLSIAIEHEAFEITKLLLEAGADIHRIGGNLTPLNHAIDAEADGALQMEQMPVPIISKLLLQKGANPFVEDLSGRNAIQFAQDYDYQTFLELVKIKK